MPRTVYSIKAEIRDHSMSIPVPENTINHGIPNACNLCHKDRDANWSLARMNEWYSPASRQKLIRRADAFVAARKNDPASIAPLLDILDEPSEGPLTRANAAGYLGRFIADPRVFPAFANGRWPIPRRRSAPSPRSLSRLPRRFVRRDMPICAMLSPTRSQPFAWPRWYRS